MLSWSVLLFFTQVYVAFYVLYIAVKLEMTILLITLEDDDNNDRNSVLIRLLELVPTVFFTTSFDPFLGNRLLHMTFPSKWSSCQRHTLTSVVASLMEHVTNQPMYPYHRKMK